MKSTRDKILDAGLVLWPNISAHAVAREVGLNSNTNVLYYFKTVDALKDAIAEHAVKTSHSKVIVQLLAVGHKAIKRMSQADRLRHLNAAV